MHRKFQKVHSRGRKDGETMRILKKECLGQDGNATQWGQHVQSHRGRGVLGMSPQAAGNRVISPRESRAQDVRSCMSLEDV